MGWPIRAKSMPDHLPHQNPFRHPPMREVHATCVNLTHRGMDLCDDGNKAPECK
jgi:hypothetical protein